MANGDVAASIGWPVVAGTDDKRMGYDEINLSRDLAAGHVKNGTHPWTSITGRWQKAQDIPTNGSNVQADIDNVNAKADTAQGAANNAANVAGMARRGDMDIAVWDRQLTQNYRALWMSNTGQVLLGYVPSTRASKTDVRRPDWTVAQLRAIPVVWFRYRHEVAKQAIDPEYPVQTRIGSIAEDLVDLDLGEFVEFDDDDQAIAIRYDLLSLAALRLAQVLADEVDVLESRYANRLDVLEGRIARLERKAP